MGTWWPGFWSPYLRHSIASCELHTSLVSLLTPDSTDSLGTHDCLAAAEGFTLLDM